MNESGFLLQAVANRRDSYLPVEDPRLEVLPIEALSCLSRSLRILEESVHCYGPLGGRSFSDLCTARFLSGFEEASAPIEGCGESLEADREFSWREFHSCMVEWILKRRRLAIPGLEWDYFILAVSAISESVCEVLRDEAKAGGFITEFLESALGEFAVKRAKRKRRRNAKRGPGGDYPKAGSTPPTIH
jgi:hypothetical protein